MRIVEPSFEIINPVLETPDGFSWYGNGNGTVICRRQDFYNAYKVKR